MSAPSPCPNGREKGTASTSTGWTRVPAFGRISRVPNVVNRSFLALDREQRFLYSVHADLDGTLGARTDLAMLSGEAGPNRKEHASSHPHDCPFDPAGRFILVADKGLDRVFSFKLDSASGKLTPNDPPFTATREGAGPRHIAFHPAMSHAYA